MEHYQKTEKSKSQDMTLYTAETGRGLKYRVQKALTSRMMLNSTWCLVATEWFNRWKRYVNYDVDMFAMEQIQHPSPGPIDNSFLLDADNQLKRDVSEGQDFVLLPADIYDELAGTFTGGPRIARQVISAGGSDHMQLQIELYPLKVVLCRENESTEKSIFISRSNTLRQLHEAAAKAYGTIPTLCRLWIDISSTQMEWQQEAATSKPTKGRRMTIEITDTDGSWRYLRGSNTSTASLGSLGNGPVRILVEMGTSLHDKILWPRDKALNRWRSELRGGDLIDAKDERGVWSEAEVVGAATTPTGELTVHFRGWTAKWNRVISPAELLTRIDPLHLHTTDWRSQLGIGDKVEYRVVSDRDNEVRWVVADVVNITGNIVQLKYKHGPLGQLLTTCTDICGEDIAALHTHIKVLPPSSVEINNGYNRLNDMHTMHNRHREGVSLAAGAVGLANLGNTCFMNAILQCLSASPPLLEAFLPPQCRFRDQINVDNPLGMHGKLASAYGRLVADMWSGRYSVVVPDALKTTIAEFRPQFGGYQQQDAQELLLFLLDGLHEDLNRIRGSKPYVVKLESTRGGLKGSKNEISDDVLSRESWRRFLLRNDSELTDHWFGQLRSQVTCTTPGCGRLSTTFDEYSSLSLPLPVSQGVAVTVTVYPLPYGSPPLKVIVETDPLSSVGELLAKLNNAVMKCKSESATVAMETCAGDEFVVVDNDGATDEEYDMCTDTNGHTDNSASTNGFTKHPEPAIHICGLLSYQIPSRIYKTYSSKALVRDITQMRDELVAYQTRHEISTAYTTSYAVSSTGVLDVYFGTHRNTTHNMYGGYHRWELLPFPVVRVSYKVGETTVGELRADLQKIVNARLQPTASAAAFDAHFTTTNALSSMGELGHNNDDVIARNYDSIVLLWQAADASVFLDKDAMSHAAVVDNRSPETSGPLNVYKCLAKFLERETLPEVETYYCSACKQHKAPIKKFDLWSCPDMLVLQLKRFRYVPGAYFVHRDKVSDFVDYPIEGLDLSSYMSSKISDMEQNYYLYDLVGVVEHIGGIGGGHYTATCKHPMNGKWYHFNDSSVSEVQPSSAVSAEAYVLFYRRRHAQLRWGGIVPLEEPLKEQQEAESEE